MPARYGEMPTKVTSIRLEPISCVGSGSQRPITEEDKKRVFLTLGSTIPVAHSDNSFSANW